MYRPKHFELNDEELIYTIMRENTFATLTSLHEDRLTSTHLPILFDEKRNQLYGHFARANKQWTDIEEQEVLTIFQGPHHYISPTWYEDLKQVPTWNYVTIHIYGRVKLLSNEETIDNLKKLTSYYEKDESVYNLGVLGDEEINRLSKGVVGFRVNIQSIEAKAKLSQHHPEERNKRVIQLLYQQNNDQATELAKLMERELMKREEGVID